LGADSTQPPEANRDVGPEPPTWGDFFRFFQKQSIFKPILA